MASRAWAGAVRVGRCCTRDLKLSVTFVSDRELVRYFPSFPLHRGGTRGQTEKFNTDRNRAVVSRCVGKRPKRKRNNGLTEYLPREGTGSLGITIAGFAEWKNVPSSFPARPFVALHLLLVGAYSIACTFHAPWKVGCSLRRWRVR